MSARSKTGARLKTFAYETFAGLDSSRDVTALDTGRKQHLAELVNASCDWRGQIVRDAGARHVEGSLPVNHVQFFTEDEVVYTEQDGSGQHLRSTLGHVDDDLYLAGAVISSSVFSRKVHLLSRGSLMRVYDGTSFRANNSASMKIMRPSFVASVQRRMAVAGIPGSETEVHISRVDDAEVFGLDEEADSQNVLRGGVIDVANFLGTADSITGLAPFEQDKLVIFTGDRALIYALDPDITKWALDKSANIRVGCASHNTIQAAGTDLLFCSRRGIHSIKRSEQNGILVSSHTLSDKVDLLYRQLFMSVEDPAQISAVYDQDRAQYHIFFPQPGGLLCKRLTLTLTPQVDQGGEPLHSTGDFLNARTGASLNGRFFIGTSGGIHELLPLEDSASDVTPDATIMTPLLWHGSLHDEKTTHSITIQAAGKGVIEMECINHLGQVVGSMRFEIDADSDDADNTSMPLSHQYERQFERRYLAAQYRFRIVNSTGIVRLVGFAIKTKE